ncbi:MAG: alanine racemase [Propionibacteriaceae bacterium]|jgi:predicted amino acid racemase|nr:alanine racemase [Propionibacteriaceae bacterium]
MYPYVEIHVDEVLQNYAVVAEMAKAQDIQLSVVTKALTGYRPLVERLIGAGVGSIGEAHVPTLQGFADLAVEKWMIRLPMMSQVADVVRFADVSLNSELTTMTALGEKALDQGRTHKVVVMVDLGDRREGVMPEHLAGVCAAAMQLPGIELYGVGVEFGCVSDIVPTPAAMDQFAELVRDVQNCLGMRLPVVSGGSSNGLDLLAANLLPDEVNHLRVGEALLTGKVANLGTPLPGGCVNPFRLTAEIVEIEEKPSQPVGARAPGQIPVADDPRFPDRGTRRRALVAVGKQDVGIHDLVPEDSAIIVEEGSSDVFVADITDSTTAYHVGDVLRFGMDYFAILPAMVSPFVEKRLV